MAFGEGLLDGHRQSRRGGSPIPTPKRKFVAAMIEVCLEQRSTGIMTGTTLSKAQRSVPEARLDRHCLEQRSTEQIGTPTITTRH